MSYLAEARGVGFTFNFRSSKPLGMMMTGCGCVLGVACVVGRYHYAVDVLAGAALGAVVCIVVVLWGVD